MAEERKDLPFGAVWGEFNARFGTPSGRTLMTELDTYQSQVASRG